METPVQEIASLIRQPSELGAQPVDQAVIAALEAATKQPAAPALTRGVFNAHIGFDKAVEHATSGKPLYIYLPISASDRMTHLRHALFLRFASYLQRALGCYVFVQVQEYKAFCTAQGNVKFDAAKKWAEETIKDVLAFDFVPERTIVLTNEACTGLDYIMLCDLQRTTTLASFTGKFFKDDSVNVGVMDSVFREGACALPSYVHKIFPDTANTRCLMLLRQSQDELYKFTCDIAKLCNQPEPFALFGGFVPAPQGTQKMPKLAKFALGASTGAQQQGKKGGKPKNEIRDYMTIYLKNTPKEITSKLNKFAFSGGKDTLAEQRELGANLAVDIPTYYLKLFLDDNEEYEKIVKYYGPGTLEEGNDARMPSGTIKKRCAEVLTAIIKDVQDKRAKVTKQQIQDAYKIRSF